MFEQFQRVLAAVGGGQCQQVGGLGEGGEVEGVLVVAVGGEADFLAAAGEVGEDGGDGASSSGISPRR